MKKHITILTIVLLSFSLRAQQYNPGIQKNSNNEPAGIFYSNSPNGNTLMPMLTSVKPVSKPKSFEEQNIISNIVSARKRGDLSTALKYQGELDKLQGCNVPRQNYSSNIIYNPEQNNSRVNPAGYEPDYQVSSIGGVNCRAISIASSLYSRSIFAVVSEYVPDTTDRLRILVSYDGGLSWITKRIWGGAGESEVDFRQGELDILPLVNGADTILFLATGVDNGPSTFIWYFQVNIRTGQITPPYPFQTYGNATGVKYYNPKFSTDQFEFPETPYVHMTAAFDSAGVLAGTRIGVFMSPFGFGDHPNYKKPNRDGSFWWNSNGQPSGYIHHDVCFLQYSDSVGNMGKVYTVLSPELNHNIYVAWSEDWGNSVDSSNTLVINEGAEVSGVCCEGNNFRNNKIAIGYRKADGKEWDYRLLYSTNGGEGSFAQYNIENTTESCTSISMQSVDSGDGRFVLAYSTENGSHWYRKFNKGSLSIPMMTNTSPGSTAFGGVQAGVWNSPNPDSCVVLWLTEDSSRSNCTRLICSAPVGITPGSETPLVFSLSQNYPNPFNPTTNIKFSIPAAGEVRLAVYDITGKEVTALINSYLNAGAYTVDFNASHLSSGVYFYKITAGSFTETKKMVLIK